MAFYGNFGMMVRAYTYIRVLGGKGLNEVSQNSIINANYILKRLSEYYDAPYKNEKIMHEAILSSHTLKKNYGVNTLDVAKRLMDYNFHPPTIYFPAIVHECIMVEPTETESIENLDKFDPSLKQYALRMTNNDSDKIYIDINQVSSKVLAHTVGIIK